MASSIQLIGSPSENFYLLGKEDKLAAPRPLTPPTPPPNMALLNFFLKNPVRTVLHAALKRYPTLEEHLTAYAEGRGTEVTDIAWPLVLADFYPLLLRANQEFPLPLVSSATVLRPMDNDLAHFKTANTSYALGEKQNLRVVYFASPHYPGIVTWSYPGHPYPQGQAWTSEGLCLSWHHLPTDKFNPHGQITNELIWQLLNNIHDLKSAKVFLKNCQVFAALSLIFTDQQESMAQVIMEGKRQIWRQIKAQRPLYFNRAENLPLHARSLLRPLKEHYLKQKKNGQKFLATTQDLSLADFWPAILDHQGASEGRRGNPAPFLPATTTAVAAILPQANQLFLLDLQNPHPVLEIFSGPEDYATLMSKAKAAGTLPKQIDLRSSGPGPLKTFPLPNFTPSPLRPFLGAMQALQKRDHQGAAAYFTLAVNQAQGREKHVALFFQNLNQYFILPVDHQKSWQKLRQELRSLRPKLPLALQDHVTLFIFRLNTILGTKSSLAQIHAPLIRRVLRYEQHLPPAIFLQVTRFLTQLRPDILDVIYPHAI